jgi:hypothetical protein
MKEYKLIKFELDGNCLTPCPYGLKGVGRIMVYSGSCQDCKHNKGKVKKQVKCSFEYDMQDEYDTDNVEEHGCIERVLPEEPKELPKIGEKWRVRQDLVIGERYDELMFMEGMKKDYIIVTGFFANGHVDTNTYAYSLEMLDGRIEEPSDCGSDCVCKEVEKSCDNCGYYDNLAYSEPCNTCTLGVTLKKVSFNWKPKYTENKLEKVEPNKKVRKYKYVCKSCDSGKCVLIVKGSPSKFDCCPMGGDAKWKLKEK